MDGFDSEFDMESSAITSLNALGLHHPCLQKEEIKDWLRFVLH
jgi:hypothetical protein